MRFERVPLSLIATITALAAAAPLRALAEMSEPEYRQALKIASEEVQRRERLRESRAGAVSSGMLKELFGRYYEKGDSWVVAAYREDSAMMRMTSDPAQLEARSGQVGVFRYEVVRVKTGLAPEVDLKVTEISGYGVDKPVDERVSHLTLTMNDQLAQSAKQYTFKRPPGVSAASAASLDVKVSPDGIRSAMTPLDLFPLDVPEVVTARPEENVVVPELPGRLQSVASRAGFKLEPARIKAFEQDDFFGRPVTVQWRQGDPWPAYLRTSQGVSILLSTKTR